MASQHDPAIRAAELVKKAETLAYEAALLKKQHRSPRAKLLHLAKTKRQLLEIEVSRMRPG